MIKSFFLSLVAFLGSIFGSVAPSPSPTPTPTPLFPYQVPAVEQAESYRIAMLGDSMVEALGPNANALRLELIKRYPGREFVTYNLGVGATNVESLLVKMEELDNYEVEMVVIGSFGYNPLSELPLEAGLRRQREVLEIATREIITKHPRAVVVFLLPMAPNKYKFAESVFTLSDEVRMAWVSEREAYINTHANFARARNIPLIDVYSESLNPEGTGDLKYISTHDFIHPSEAGIQLMAETIAEAIFENEFFPVESDLE